MIPCSGATWWLNHLDRDPLITTKNQAKLDSHYNPQYPANKQVVGGLNPFEKYEQIKLGWSSPRIGYTCCSIPFLLYPCCMENTCKLFISIFTCPNLKIIRLRYFWCYSVLCWGRLPLRNTQKNNFHFGGGRGCMFHYCWTWWNMVVPHSPRVVTKKWPPPPGDQIPLQVFSDLGGNGKKGYKNGSLGIGNIDEDKISSAKHHENYWMKN